MKKNILTDLAPKAVGPYSQGALNRDILFVSGQLPIDPDTGKLISDDIEAEVKQTLENCVSILKAADFLIGDVLKVTIFTTNLKLFDAINKTYANFFGLVRPARSAVEVSALPKSARVEIELIAIRS